MISTQRANAASRSTRDRRPPPRSGPSTASAVEPVEASVRGAEHRRRHASALVQVLKPNLDARRDFVSYCAYYVTVPAKIEHVPSRNRCQRGEQRAVRCARPPAVDGKNKNSMTHVMYRSPECRAQKSAPMGPWQSCTSWRDAWPSLSLGARTQVELLDAIRGYYLVAGCFVGWTAASKRAAWLGSMPQSRRYIAKGCPHVRHPWLRRERFGMMRPSWGLERARGGAPAPNACTLEPYLCDALNHT